MPAAGRFGIPQLRDQEKSTETFEREKRMKRVLFFLVKVLSQNWYFWNILSC
jgi:hypothetical protein